MKRKNSYKIYLKSNLKKPIETYDGVIWRFSTEQQAIDFMEKCSIERQDYYIVL